MMLPTHIAIVGPMGSGKSTLAAALAGLTGRSVLDSDRLIEEETGMTSGQMAREYGIEALHAREAAVARRSLLADTPAIVTPAASVVDVLDVRRLLAERSFVVWLDIDVETLQRTLETPSHRRRATDDEIRVLAKERRAGFEAIADVRFTERGDSVRMAEEVLRVFDHGSGS